MICGVYRERKQPFGKGTTLAARLLQLSSSASAPNTREHISWLLFMLSDSDAERFVLNIGYGYASGFLLTHNIPLPKSSDMPSTSASSRPINPITGQTLDSEPPAGDPFAGMSQEEKEREAERLFVLFERHATHPSPLPRYCWCTGPPAGMSVEPGLISGRCNGDID
jgi:hypothetical protein